MAAVVAFKCLEQGMMVGNGPPKRCDMYKERATELAEYVECRSGCCRVQEKPEGEILFVMFLKGGAK